MGRVYKPITNLRNIVLSPMINPLMQPQELTTKRRYVKSGRADEMISSTTGEIIGVSAIHTIEEKDDMEFVKVFAAGVAAGYELSKTAQRVFQVVLDQYQRTPMSRGFVDYVNLLWFDNGIDGRALEMTERTFQLGLKELLDKRFISPKDGVSYWTNPALFFKGDRVMFIKEYRRRSKAQVIEADHMQENKK
jgi:hypothetical protein